LRVAEWIVVSYLAYLVGLLPFRPIPRSSRSKLLVPALLGIGVVVSAPWWPDSPVAGLLRTWLPMPFILVAYWLTGFYFVDPQPEYEERFVAFDRRARSALGATHLIQRAPRPLLEFLEVAYFSCYIVVPLGMLAFHVAGFEHDSDRYWSVVVLAELACYGVLPWIRTRPPWTLRPAGPFSQRPVLLHRLNLLFVRATSTRANTFPSGHAAGAVAAAMAVWAVWPLAGVGFTFIALSIIAGSVFGEYHYAGDAIAGAGTAIAAWGIITLIGV
jgi:hypothetical protein